MSQKRIRLSFCGILQGLGEAVPLWNVEQHGTKFPYRGTVSSRSLRMAGYFVPDEADYVKGQVFAA
jgi:hypothetical protein